MSDFETNPIGTAAELEKRRKAFDRALRMSWQMVDPLRPSGEPGSYARGEHNGIVAALRTVADNHRIAMSAPLEHEGLQPLDLLHLADAYAQAQADARESGDYTIPRAARERLRAALFDKSENPVKAPRECQDNRPASL